jgi:tRNA(fMet)-specific endonuclease VapC
MAPRYLLDTNTCIYIRRNQPTKVLERFEKTDPGELGISIITYGELFYGATKSLEPERATAALDSFLSLVPVLSLPESAGRTYGQLRAALEVKGSIIGTNDLWIAAHALAADLTLVTNNEREFKRVKDLKFENWAK